MTSRRRRAAVDQLVADPHHEAADQRRGRRRPGGAVAAELPARARRRAARAAPGSSGVARDDVARSAIASLGGELGETARARVQVATARRARRLRGPRAASPGWPGRRAGRRPGRLAGLHRGRAVGRATGAASGLPRRCRTKRNSSSSTSSSAVACSAAARGGLRGQHLDGGRPGRRARTSVTHQRRRAARRHRSDDLLPEQRAGRARCGQPACGTGRRAPGARSRWRRAGRRPRTARRQAATGRRPGVRERVEPLAGRGEGRTARAASARPARQRLPRGDVPSRRSRSAMKWSTSGAGARRRAAPHRRPAPRVDARCRPTSARSSAMACWRSAASCCSGGATIRAASRASSRSCA